MRKVAKNSNTMKRVDKGTGSCHEIAIDMSLGDVGDASLAKNFTSFLYYVNEDIRN